MEVFTGINNICSRSVVAPGTKTNLFVLVQPTHRDKTLFSIYFIFLSSRYLPVPDHPFMAALSSSLISPSHPLFFLCSLGIRSMPARRGAAKLGAGQELRDRPKVRRLGPQ